MEFLNEAEEGWSSFNLSYTFLRKDIYVSQVSQHSRGRRVPGGCTADAAVLRARGQASFR
ncbi:hypothetical protein A7Q09_06750 [Methylacidiphilum sp. Yel]|nr:hypothetical protein A7Q09_06750 [Methylacidiphilum sp. Yel]